MILTFLFKGIDKIGGASNSAFDFDAPVVKLPAVTPRAVVPASVITPREVMAGRERVVASHKDWIEKIHRHDANESKVNDLAQSAAYDVHNNHTVAQALLERAYRRQEWNKFDHTHKPEWANSIHDVAGEPFYSRKEIRGGNHTRWHSFDGKSFSKDVIKAFEKTKSPVRTVSRLTKGIDKIGGRANSAFDFDTESESEPEPRNHSIDDYAAKHRAHNLKHNEYYAGPTGEADYDEVYPKRVLDHEWHQSVQNAKIHHEPISGDAWDSLHKQANDRGQLAYHMNELNKYRNLVPKGYVVPNLRKGIDKIGGASNSAFDFDAPAGKSESSPSSIPAWDDFAVGHRHLYNRYRHYHDNVARVVAAQGNPYAAHMIQETDRNAHVAAALSHHVGKTVKITYQDRKSGKTATHDLRVDAIEGQPYDATVRLMHGAARYPRTHNLEHILEVAGHDIPSGMAKGIDKIGGASNSAFDFDAEPVKQKTSPAKPMEAHEWMKIPSDYRSVGEDGVHRRVVNNGGKGAGLEPVRVTVPNRLSSVGSHMESSVFADGPLSRHSPAQLKKVEDYLQREQGLAVKRYDKVKTTRPSAMFKMGIGIDLAYDTGQALSNMSDTMRHREADLRTIHYLRHGGEAATPTFSDTRHYKKPGPGDPSDDPSEGYFKELMKHDKRPVYHPQD